MRHPSYRALAAIDIAFTSVAFSSAGRAPKAAQPRALVAELWVEPPPNRDLFYGVGGPALAPDPRQLYKVIEIKATGYSEGYAVVDESKREWSVKFPPEAHSEVAASRLLWGIGYHQPPIYYLEGWRALGAEGPNPQRGARFRQKKPDFHGLDSVDDWSYYENPFKDTVQMHALLAFHAMLGNSDLKDKQNALYKLSEPLEGASEWYVARDLGQTFGRTAVINPPRADIDAFEQAPFILGTSGDRVMFDYHGRHKELFENVRIGDVVWLCDRLSKLSDRQLSDAFRAGGFDPPLAARFINRLKAKVAEGLALASLQKPDKKEKSPS
jgi:hypothetical protein